MQSLKAVNKLSPAMNAKIRAQQKGSFVNGKIDTIPYFNSYFLTGSRNSLYVYSMVGGSPTLGGTTTVPTEIVPLTSELDFGGVPLYIFDPSGVFVHPADQDSDVNLFAEGPIYDATTTYPGPPADTGQMLDTFHRAQFRKVRTANWHTHLSSVFGPFLWYQFLEYNNGDWGFICCDPNNNAVPVFNINTISTNFNTIVTDPLELPATTNNILPVIVTDYLTAFDPSNGACCELGFHAAQAGVFDPSGVLVWTWGTWIPHNADQGLLSPFGPFGQDTEVLTHELGEIFDDPFVQVGGTLVPAWVDGSASFPQGNMEVGDAIEAMTAADALYNVPLTTTTGPYTYTEQNLATLEWFSRNPFNGGLYSWPNEGTLSHNAHPVGCTTPPSPITGISPCALYGQGSASFFFGPPF